MIRALTTAATGLEAQQANIERISHDIANANTDGYKRSRNEFEDLLYETVKDPGAPLGNGSTSPVGVQTGLGVKVGAGYKNFEQGPARMTYNPLDIMIEGQGFFPVEMPDGNIAYTRTGSFKKDAEGRIVLSNGSLLVPQVTIPNNTIGISISQNGEIKAALPGQAEAIIGQIQLVNFINPRGLIAQGKGLYLPSQAAGDPIQAIPGENGMGLLQAGALEGSNVNIANSMVDMITTQRTYEMNTKMMGVADKMLQSTVNVK